MTAYVVSIYVTILSSILANIARFIRRAIASVSPAGLATFSALRKRIAGALVPENMGVCQARFPALAARVGQAGRAKGRCHIGSSSPWAGAVGADGRSRGSA